MTARKLALGLSLLLAGCQTGGDGPKSSVIDYRLLSENLGVNMTYIDTTVRPQDDFYHYVNGRWLVLADIPEGLGSLGAFKEMSSNVSIFIWDHIDDLSIQPDEILTPVQKQIKSFFLRYKATADVPMAQSDLSGIKDMLQVIDGLSTASEIMNFAGRLARLGIEAPFAIEKKISVRKPGYHILHVEQGGLSLQPSTYAQLNDHLSPAYQSFKSYFDAARHYLETEIDVDAYLALEQHFYQARRSREEKRLLDAANNLFDRDHGYAAFNNLNWTAYFDGLGVKPETINLVDQDFAANVDASLVGEGLNQWRHYLKGRLLWELAPDMPKELQDAYYLLSDHVRMGRQIERSNNIKAYVLISHLFSDYFDQQYIQRLVAVDTKQRVLQMAENIRQVFQKRIQNMSWMDPKTKQQALAKLTQLRFKAVGPDRLTEQAMVPIDNPHFMDMLMDVRRWSTDQSLAVLDQKIAADYWRVPATTVNAFYTTAANEMILPAGILQPPFFDDRTDDAVNYGGIGGIIGHEIVHGFDDQGHLVDSKGVLRDWWSEKAKQEFERRADLVAERYNNYQFTNIGTVNGRLTLGENIADIAGLSLSWDAYQIYARDKKLNEIVGFTADQRFFLGWGQVWRRKYRDFDLRRRLQEDPHSPAELRVNVVLSQMPGFYQAFGVTSGDQLWLPTEQRLKIWQ